MKRGRRVSSSPPGARRSRNPVQTDWGYDFARALGHTIGEHVCPALVPLILPGGHQLRDLSGIAVEATLTLRSGTGKVLKAFTNSLLCTHFGLSGPCALDVSRYWRAARIDDPGSSLRACFLPGTDEAALDARVLANPKSTPLALLRGELPDSIPAWALRVGGGRSAGTTRTAEPRNTSSGSSARASVLICRSKGDRGFTHAEVTMGGVPLREVRLETMESRVCPGLHLIGEILDVDGRIGGFNFQWAWSTGYIAGTSVS